VKGVPERRGIEGAIVLSGYSFRDCGAPLRDSELNDQIFGTETRIFPAFIAFGKGISNLAASKINCNSKSEKYEKLMDTPGLNDSLFKLNRAKQI
jgi:hypothetical protein